MYPQLPVRRNRLQDMDRDVIKAIKSGKHVYAMLARATEGQFGTDITMASWRKAMKELGFTEFVEVGLGGDLTAKSEAEEWREAYQEGKKKVTSCCPGFVNMVRKHYPELNDAVSTTVSPMCGVSRMIKAKDPGAVTVFIGPCLAKKSEVVDQKIEGNADYAMTYSEIRAMMRAKGVALGACGEYISGSFRIGKRFGNSGGVAAAVQESLKESGNDIDIKVCKANGAAECKKALLLMKLGKLPEDFIEGMACDGGCVGGTEFLQGSETGEEVQRCADQEADDRGIYKNLSNLRRRFLLHAQIIREIQIMKRYNHRERSLRIAPGFCLYDRSFFLICRLCSVSFTFRTGTAEFQILYPVDQKRRDCYSDEGEDDPPERNVTQRQEQDGQVSKKICS